MSAALQHRLYPPVMDGSTCGVVYGTIGECGAPAALLVLASCEHEHARWLPRCGPCHRDTERVGAWCRPCLEAAGERAHDCYVRTIEVRPFQAEPPR